MEPGHSKPAVVHKCRAVGNRMDARAVHRDSHARNHGIRRYPCHCSSFLDGYHGYRGYRQGLVPLPWHRPPRRRRVPAGAG